MGGIIDNKSGDCNFLFIISAPSGTGKTTICKRLLKQNQDLCLSISATTRAPRTGEVDGKDYFFITKEEYLAKVNTGGFLEHACVFDNYYRIIKRLNLFQVFQIPSHLQIIVLICSLLE